MGDRFYRQQCEFANLTATELMLAQRNPESEEGKRVFNKIIRKLNGNVPKNAKSNKLCKADLLKAFFTYLEMPVITGFDKLTIATMENIMKVELEYDPTWVMPTGRLRKTYEEAIKKVFVGKGCDFSKLTIKAMREFLEEWGLKHKN